MCLSSKCKTTEKAAIFILYHCLRHHYIMIYNIMLYTYLLMYQTNWKRDGFNFNLNSQMNDIVYTWTSWLYINGHDAQCITFHGMTHHRDCRRVDYSPKKKYPNMLIRYLLSIHIFLYLSSRFLKWLFICPCALLPWGIRYPDILCIMYISLLCFHIGPCCVIVYWITCSLLISVQIHTSGVIFFFFNLHRSYNLNSLIIIIIVYIYIAHNNQKDSICALHKFHTTTLKRDMFWEISWNYWYQSQS